LQRAREAGQFRAAQTWLLLLSQLVNLGDTSPLSEYSLKPSSHVEAPSQLSPTSMSVSSRRGRDHSNSHTASTTLTSGSTRIDTRPIETSPLSYRTRAGLSTEGHGTPPSSSPSPRSKSIPLSSRLSRPFSPNSPHDTSMSSSSKLSTVSRRGSTVLPILPPTRPLALRRASRSTPSPGGGVSVDEQPLTLQHVHVGEGALDDSESSSGSEASVPEQNTLSPDTASSQGGPQASSSSITKLSCDSAPRSVLLKVPTSHEDAPDEAIAEEEGSSGYDTDASDESRSQSPDSPSSSESPAPISHYKLSQASNQKHEPTSQILLPVLSGHRGTTMTFSRRSLTKQESQNSMRTVTIAPSDTASVYAPSIDRVSFDTPDPAPDGRMTVATSAEGMSTRRPSPQPHRAVSATVPALGLSNMDDTRNINTNGPVPNFVYSTRLSEEQTRQIIEDEAQLREIGWKALRETFDWFAEKVSHVHNDFVGG
jgi:SEA/GATOR complex protein SEA2/WDR24